MEENACGHLREGKGAVSKNLSDVMKVRFNGTFFCFYLAYYLYAEMDISVRMIRSG